MIITYITKGIRLPKRESRGNQYYVPPNAVTAFKRGGTPSLRDGRIPRWVVGGRRYQTAPKRTLGIFTDQLKISIEDWTFTLRGSAVFIELTGSGHTSCKGERRISRIGGTRRQRSGGVLDFLCGVRVIRRDHLRSWHQLPFSQEIADRSYLWILWILYVAAVRTIRPAGARVDRVEIYLVVQDGRDQHIVLAVQHVACAVRKPAVLAQLAWQGLWSGVKAQGKLACALEKIRALYDGIAIGGAVVGRPVL